VTIEFSSWGKTPRLFRDIVITEKIDGTNSAVIIQQIESIADAAHDTAIVQKNGQYYEVGAQSKNRLIYPGKTTDNHGFADWVYTNAEALFDVLGAGRHYGEWWGHGIQRGYGMDRKAFSLFNTEKRSGEFPVAGIQVGQVILNTVPVLYQGEFSQESIRLRLEDLERYGSFAAPMYRNPEGICVYHTQSKQVYKVTLDNQDKGKWEA